MQRKYLYGATFSRLDGAQTVVANLLLPISPEDPTALICAREAANSFFGQYFDTAKLTSAASANDKVFKKHVDTSTYFYISGIEYLMEAYE